MTPQEIREQYQLLLHRYRQGEIDQQAFRDGLDVLKTARMQLKAKICGTAGNGSFDPGGWSGANPQADIDEFQRFLEGTQSTTSVLSPQRKTAFRLEGMPQTGHTPRSTRTQAGPSRFAKSLDGVFHQDPAQREFKPQVGEVLGDHYVLVRVLGEGELGATWLGYDRSNKRYLVIKPMPRTLHFSERFMSHLNESVHKVVFLRGPHICPLYRTLADDVYGNCLVSAYLDAIPLDEYHAHYSNLVGPLSVNTLVRLLWPVAQALDHAHAHGVVHRGLKMRNILVGRRCSVQVTDFLVSETVRVALNQSTRLNDPPFPSATYQAPEIWSTDLYSARSDQFALGVIAYRLLAGRFPFSGKTNADLRRQVENAEIPPLPDQPASVAATIARALARDPEERFPDCLRFLRNLVEPISDDTPLRSGLFSQSVFGWMSQAFGTPDPTLPKPVAADKSVRLWPFPVTGMSSPATVPTVFVGSAGQEVPAQSVSIQGVPVQDRSGPSATASEFLDPEKASAFFQKAKLPNPREFLETAYPYRRMTDRVWFLGSLAVIIVAVGVFTVALGQKFRDDNTPYRSANFSKSGRDSRRSASSRTPEDPDNPSTFSPANAKAFHEPDDESGFAGVAGTNAPPEIAIYGGIVASEMSDTPVEPVPIAEDAAFFQQFADADEERIQKVFRRLQEKARQGESTAKRRLGLMYATGTGVVKNRDIAAQWFRESAEEGDALAMFQIALCYEFGLGVRKSPEIAFQWYQRGAYENEPMSWYRQGLCYENGVGVDKDAAKAAKAFRKAAALGLSKPVVSLGSPP